MSGSLRTWVAGLTDDDVILGWRSHAQTVWRYEIDTIEGNPPVAARHRYEIEAAVTYGQEALRRRLS